jgi:hypothetical protein
LEIGDSNDRTLEADLFDFGAVHVWNLSVGKRMGRTARLLARKVHIGRIVFPGPEHDC